MALSFLFEARLTQQSLHANVEAASPADMLRYTCVTQANWFAMLKELHEVLSGYESTRHVWILSISKL